MGVCDDISVRFFFFDKAKRQRFILQNEALALVELKRKKIVLRQCARTAAEEKLLVSVISKMALCAM